MTEPLRIFLDANILFSAAYKPDSGLLALWTAASLLLLTSFYAAEEARRNCRSREHLERLESLLAQTHIVSDALYRALPAHIALPPKDQPILAAAIDAGAAFLMTGDKEHFAAIMGQPIETRHGTLRVMQPRTFLDYLTQRPGTRHPLQ